MDLSIVIPVYNESYKIAHDVKAAVTFLNENNLAGQIIIVDDGSEDNTAEVAKSIKVPQSVKLEVVRYEQHRGKGYAVRKGMEQTKGDYVMFADSGCCVPYQNTLRGLDLLKSGECDIAHGSRKIQESHINVTQNLYRHVCSRMFHWFVIKSMKISAGLTDTQCGFKIYRGDVARHLYDECITDGFAFDIEIIMRAQKESYRVKEFPIDWTCDPDSRLSPTRSLRRVLTELWKIRRVMSEG
jgi:dolichyl-phosphate beta-glucosyltransferase